MSTVTLARTATARAPLSRPSALASLLQRLIDHVRAPAVPAAAMKRQIDQGATVWVARPLGRTVTCEAGTLWLAFDGEPLDVILEAGQAHRCTKGSKLSIHALACATLSVA